METLKPVGIDFTATQKNRPRLDREATLWRLLSWILDQKSTLRMFKTMLVPHMPPRPMPLLEIEGKLYLLATHLFSGRRREEDLHAWMHHLAPRIMPGVEVISISLDTAVLGQQGDLDGGPAHRFLTQLASRWWIGCNVTGPPCETWSAARHMQKPSHLKGRWPRPLRSSSRLWGLPNLSIRELRQLRAGSSF